MPHSLRLFVTRPDPGGTELCQHIQAQGDVAIHFPTIAFAPPPDLHDFETVLQQLSDQDWLIFISPQAVRASVSAIRRAWPQLSSRVHIAAIGAGTAHALEQADYQVALQPPSDEWNSEGLLKATEFQSVHNKRVTIVQGVGGRDRLALTLAERGATVLSWVTYQRVMPAINVTPYLPLINNGKIDAIICTSYEGVSNLKQLIGDAGWAALKQIPLIVVSERTKALAQDAGFQRIWVASNASHQAILGMISQKRNDMSNSTDKVLTNANEVKQANAWWGFSLLGLIILLLIGAMGAIYFQLTQANIAMTNHVAQLQQQTTDSLQQFKNMSQSVQQLQQMNTSDIRTTLLNRWYATEAQYLVRLAKNYIIFMHNTPAALVLLQQADQTLENIQDGSVDDIRQQLAQYIATLNAIPAMDATTLYTQVNAVNDQIDTLPFPVSPLQREKSTTAPVVAEESASWWQTAFNRGMQSLRDIVIVRYNNTKMLPLVMPDEKNFLLQNLHAELANAMWAVLHHNATVYQTSLAHANNWIQQYFVQQAPATINVLQALNTLKAANIEPEPLDMAAVMQQFDDYLKA